MRRRLDRYAGLRSRLERDDADADARDELEHHLQSRIAEYEAAGLSRSEAERHALRRIGDMDRYVEETARIDASRSRATRRREMVSGLARELRQAGRSLGRSPWFTLAAVVTLGVGLGAATSVGALLDRVALRPLPYGEPDRLVWVASRLNGIGVNGQWRLSVAGYFDYREKASTLSELGGYVSTVLTVSGEGSSAERVPAAVATSSLMSVLGFRPAAGRLLTVADDDPAAASVVILSNSFWRRRYGGDPSVVGRMIQLNASPFEVVGVLSAGDALPDADTDLWLPAQFDPAARPVNSHYVSAIGRLAEGATVASAQAELDRLTARFPEEYPTAYSPSFMEEAQFRSEVVPLRDEVLGDTARLLWILFGSVALVLVIACANVANLFLVRAEVRRREAAVRSALGGGRAELAAHYLAESLLVAGSAAVLGLVLAQVVITWLPAGAAGGIPRLEELRLGWTGAGLLTLAALTAGVVFGLFPLLRLPRDGGALLREGGRGTSASRRQQRVRAVLVAGEVALALVLLSGAGLMVRSWLNLRSVDPGLDPAGLLTLELNLPHHYETWESTYEFHRSLIDRVRTLPGVRDAATTTVLPLAGPGPCASMYVEGQPVDADSQPPCLLYRLVSPGWFDVMGIETRGRTPGWEDVEGGSGAIVVTEAVARRFWPDGSALGRGLKGNGSEPPFYRVSAVTGALRGRGLDEPPTEEVYFPLLPIPGAQLWGPPKEFTLVVRTAGNDPMALLPQLRTLVTEMDADVPIANVRPMEAVIARSVTRTTFTLVLLAVAAGMALLLSVVGLYGLIAYVVSQRRAEIGVRMALGAQARQVTREVVLQSLTLAVAGIATGLALTFVAVRALRALLFDVSPTDPLTLLAVSVLLALLAVLASWGPARRAANVSPMEVMRVE